MSPTLIVIIVIAVLVIIGIAITVIRSRERQRGSRRSLGTPALALHRVDQAPPGPEHRPGEIQWLRQGRPDGAARSIARPGRQPRPERPFSSRAISRGSWRYGAGGGVSPDGAGVVVRVLCGFGVATLCSRCLDPEECLDRARG